MSWIGPRVASEAGRTVICVTLSLIAPWPPDWPCTAELAGTSATWVIVARNVCGPGGGGGGGKNEPPNPPTYCSRFLPSSEPRYSLPLADTGPASAGKAAAALNGLAATASNSTPPKKRPPPVLGTGGGGGGGITNRSSVPVARSE